MAAATDPKLDESSESDGELEIWDTDFGDDYEEMVCNNSDSDADDIVMTKEEWIAACKIVCPFRTKRDIELDTYEDDYPELYKNIMDLCQLAVTHYQNTTTITPTGETYKFVKLNKAKVWFNEGVEYTLTISAKNLNDEETIIEAVGRVRQGDQLEILSSHRLKI